MFVSSNTCISLTSILKMASAHFTEALIPTYHNARDRALNTNIHRAGTSNVIDCDVVLDKVRGEFWT